MSGGWTRFERGVGGDNGFWWMLFVVFIIGLVIKGIVE